MQCVSYRAGERHVSQQTTVPLQAHAAVANDMWRHRLCFARHDHDHARRTPDKRGPGLPPPLPCSWLHSSICKFEKKTAVPLSAKMELQHQPCLAYLPVIYRDLPTLC